MTYTLHNGLESRIPAGLGSQDMRPQSIGIFIMAAILTGCTSIPTPKPIPTGSLEKFQALAAQYHSVVTVPQFETSPEAVDATVKKTIADGNTALDVIGRPQGRRGRIS